ncbi:MAG: PolC-type DNA polymerase III, partial [Lachnospiraceae bacterium]|nr:PolC-type DNA polymerase III [Lachnospiraceae bacterium]
SFNHHRAVDDAEERAMIFERFVEMLEKKEIDNLDKLAKWSKGAPEIIRKKPSYHIIILAANEVGRTNLYRLVSYSHLKYFARRPRIPRSLLEQYREGLIIGSACEAGELYKAVLRNEDEDRLNRLCEFYDYYEIQPIGNNFFMLESEKYPQIQTKADLQEINRKIVELGEKYQKLVVATCDVHFMDPEDAIYREIVQAGQGMKDEEQPPLYLHTTDEMLEEFSYLGREKAKEVVITNTNLVADMIEKIEPVYPDKAPPVIPNSDEILREICEAKAYSMYGNPLPPQVKKRLEHELDSIIRNGFAVMYIIAQKLVWKSNEDGYLVGSRGSVGSSFVATMSGITEVNPLPAHYYCEKCHYVDFDSEEVKKFAGSSGCDMPPKKCPNCGAELIRDGHDIPFETFLGFYGDKEPDIDLNFSGEYQSKAHNYTEVIFGAGQTFRAGTVGTLADKTAYGYVKKFYEEQGISKRNAEIERLLAGCTGVQRTTGQHPGGIIVLPMGWEIYTFTPVQHPANDMTTTTVTTHFDYHSIDHNLLKLDILGHDDPTMIRMLEDLTGIDAKTIPMDDEKVISLFDNTSALGVTPDDLLGCDLGSLGLPELGTDFVMQMLRDTKPKCFSDIVRISGLSHGTDVWLNNAQYFIKEGNCTLSTAICTRDDIMTFLIQIGVENGLAFKIMESVRKGKGLTEDMEAAMKEAGVEDWYIESCKRIKYMFPKAHAVAYVMMAFRIAYFKVYYPLAYYAAYFSIRAKAFNYEKMCMGKSQLESYMRDYKKRASVQSGGLTQKEQDEYGDMKIVQEMYARGYSFQPIDIFKASAYDFQIMDYK